MSSKRQSPTRLDPKHGVFDFSSVRSFGRSYLRTYYANPPAEDERAVFQFLHEQLRRIEGAPVFMEIGCGPTVHHMFPVAPRVNEIQMSDYLEENLNEVRLWRDRDAQAHDWSSYAAYVLGLEGTDPSESKIREREQLVRQKISHLKKCDLKVSSPFTDKALYPAVGCFYVTEEIGIAKDEWRKVMQRLATIVEPGGYLFLSALRATDRYLIQGLDGNSYYYPCAFLIEEDFKEVLPAIGFDQEETVLETAKVEGLEEEGLNSVILVAARKGMR